ncbi:MAG: ergothioneine biosynthesis protein EgtB, partial [Acidimicrobiales bacterium]
MTPAETDTTPRTRTGRGSRLARAYAAVREATEDLAAPLSAEDQTVQSMPDVSPTKWHRGHTSWFFETFLLVPELRSYEQHHPIYAFIFNSYYEAVGARHPRAERGLLSRPGVAAVTEYREHVDEAMAELLTHPLSPETLDLVELGIHHEQQHQELLLMDVKHVLSVNPLLPAYNPAPVGVRTDIRGEAPKTQWIEHPGGAVEIGHEGAEFCYDNESPRHAALLVPFALADRPVTCGEWTEFVDDGGYTRPELWLTEGWSTVQGQCWRAPLYWDLDTSETATVFTLDGPRPIDPLEPVVHVSYFEADAFARWAGARLPTEEEWESVAATARPRHAPFGLHPTPDDGPGFFGTVWQWTSSSYCPYPGFRPAAGAVGEYNG